MYMVDFFTQLKEVLQEGFVVIKKHGPNHEAVYEMIDVNTRLETMLGIERKELLGGSLHSLTSAAQWEKLAILLEQQDQYLKQTVILAGHYFTAQVIPMDEDLLCLMLVQTMPPKRSTANLHDVLFEYAPDIILYIELDGCIINANQKACIEYGYSKEELCSMNIQKIRHPDYASIYQTQMELADRSGILFECIHMRKNNMTMQVEVHAKRVNTEDGSFRVHIIRDITERKAQEAKIAWLAKYDALTGISNRGHFLLELEQEIHRCERSRTSFVLMMFDIDKFKLINDHYGHEAGDVVLQAVAKRVENILRSTDVVARLGGDEFVILQRNVEQWEEAFVLAKRILAATEVPIMYQTVLLYAKVSIGICQYPLDAVDANGLLACADKAMYQVKRQQGGSYGRYLPDSNEN